MHRFVPLALVALLGGCSRNDDAGLSGRCPAPTEAPRQFYVSATIGVSAASYDGPAIIERSTTDDLVLAFEQDAGGGTVVCARATIGSLQPMPILPPGAKVWFSLDPLAPQFAFGPSEQTMTIRDREGGTLLLGAAQSLTPPFDEPISVRGVTAGCIEPYRNECFPGTTVTHQQVEIAADSVVTVADGETATIALGGVDYDVGVYAQSVSGVSSSPCQDAFPPYGVSLAVLAHDPASLIAGLEIAGIMPACVPTAPTPTCAPVCPSGQYCWDFKDHDPYCGGKACTAPCVSDADCVAFYANHANAANARCGTDHLCDPIGFGGAFFCAAR